MVLVSVELVDLCPTPIMQLTSVRRKHLAMACFTAALHMLHMRICTIEPKRSSNDWLFLQISNVCRLRLVMGMIGAMSKEREIISFPAIWAFTGVHVCRKEVCYASVVQVGLSAFL